MQRCSRSAHREAYTAWTKRQEGYPATAAAHDAVGSWIVEHGRARAAFHREVYHPSWATAGRGHDAPAVGLRERRRRSRRQRL
ncbi:hypothetical protein ACFWNE_33310 [Streptomyces goshikiensis]|uniref:hypothetical protein n=1 Tax=Streptomyces goshikiensis TaxID=1942 RepID=UPI00365BB815